MCAKKKTRGKASVFRLELHFHVREKQMSCLFQYGYAICVKGGPFDSAQASVTSEV